MRIYDISMEISPRMTVYKNRAENRPVFQTVKNITTHQVQETVVSMNLHTGTHIDAARHIIAGGTTLNNLDLSQVITDCKVIDLTGVIDGITVGDLEGKNIISGDFVLLKTKNSYTEQFELNFVYLKNSGASYLKNIGIKGVGIDALGIERDQPGHDTHQTLLSSGIIILEGLRLRDVEEGEYLLVAAPIKFSQTDASPVRAVLIKSQINRD